MHQTLQFALEQADIDWKKTKAWSAGGYYGRIFMNVRGRERQSLAERLRAMIGPEFIFYDPQHPANGQMIEDAQIYDILPSLLARYAMQAPPNLRGKVLWEYP